MFFGLQDGRLEACYYSLRRNSCKTYCTTFADDPITDIAQYKFRNISISLQKLYYILIMRLQYMYILRDSRN